MLFRVIVPTRNGGRRWREAARALAQYVADPTCVLAIDSQSSDGSDAVARECGFRCASVAAATFSHGGTRQQALEQYCSDAEFIVFLTQDAVLAGRHSIPALLSAFADPEVACAYGRQLPHTDATPFAAHATLFNYPARSEKRVLADRDRLGIKAAFLSNSFAAYRVADLQACGGFPAWLIAGEDCYVAMRALQRGKAVFYCAEATAFHSHNNSALEDLYRFFDWGVMHAQIPELLAEFGAPESEGLRFLRSESAYVASQAWPLLPLIPLRAGLKYVGYRLGRAYRALPKSLCQRLSMTRGYWSGTLPKVHVPS